MKGFKSAQNTQRFLSAGELIYQNSQPPRHNLLAAMSKKFMLEGINNWKKINGILVPKQA